jgi:CheY-like chemotaxis protein
LLVVDNEQTVARTMRRLLRSYDVELAYSGDEALQRCTNEHFDLVLCDLMMPGTDGVAFYEGLQAQKNPIAERVVFMTGGAFTPRTTTFLAETTNLILSKPFDAATLRTLVQECLAGRS